MELSPTAALLVVDFQRGFEDTAHWGPRNNLDCEANVAALVGGWRAAGRPLVFVRHDSTEPDSPLRPGTPGNALRPELDGIEPDLLVSKSVNASFFGEPELGPWLRARGAETIVVCGISTNHCVETTARVGANLGFEVLFALDATHTFDRAGPDGVVLSADELARATATSLHGEFATIVHTDDLVGAGVSG